MHALCHVLISVKTVSECYAFGVVKLEGRQLSMRRFIVFILKVK